MRTHISQSASFIQLLSYMPDLRTSSYDVFMGIYIPRSGSQRWSERDVASGWGTQRCWVHRSYLLQLLVAGWAVAERSRKTLARLYDMAQLHSNMMHSKASAHLDGYRVQTKGLFGRRYASRPATVAFSSPVHLYPPNTTALLEDETSQGASSATGYISIWKT
jgi:hypothetical protein